MLRALIIGGRITVRLISSLTRLDLTKKGDMLPLECNSVAGESKLVQFETSHSEIVHSTVGVL